MTFYYFAPIFQLWKPALFPSRCDYNIRSQSQFEAAINIPI